MTLSYKLLVRQNITDPWIDIDTERIDISGKQPLNTQPFAIEETFNEHILQEAKVGWYFAIEFWTQNTHPYIVDVFVDGQKQHELVVTNSNGHQVVEGCEKGSDLLPFRFEKTPVAQDADEMRQNRLKEQSEKYAHLGRIIIKCFEAKFMGISRSTGGKDFDSNKVQVVKEAESKLFGTITGLDRSKNMRNPRHVVNQHVAVYNRRGSVPNRTICITYRDILGIHFQKMRYGIPIMRSPPQDTPERPRKRARMSVSPPADSVILIDDDIESSGQQQQNSAENTSPQTILQTRDHNKMDEIAKWSSDKVAEWIAGLDPKYVTFNYNQLFKNNDIDGAALLKVDESNLKEMGVTVLGHRKSLLYHINRILL